MIELGDLVKDWVTGFAGIVVSRHEYLNGCVRIAVQPQELREGKPIDSQVFDIEQLTLVKKAEPREVEPSGGPHNEPSRPAIPQR